MQQPSQLQQLPQRPAPAQNPKTEVQLELEKLYKENGRDLPEMIDVRNPQPINQPGQTGTATQGQSTPQGLVPGQLQAPQQFSPQGQPHQAGTAPKKKSVFSKWFGKDDASATSPVETPYIPPTARTFTTAAPMGNQSIPPVAGVVNYGQVFQGNGTSNPSAAPQPQQYSQQPQPQFGGIAPQQPAVTAAPVNTGLDAPVYSETPSTAATSNALPQMDFNAPLEAPVQDGVELGQSAPLSTAPQTAQPEDPFSDNALFPGTATPPAKVALNEVQTPVAQEAVPAEAIPQTAESAPVEENPYSGLTLDDNPFSKPSTRHTTFITPRQIPAAQIPAAQIPAAQIPAAPISPEPKISETGPPALMIPPNENGNEADEPPLVLEQSEPRRPARISPTVSRQTRAKQEMIEARKGLRGLKGFCPVVLRDDRDLVDAQSQFRAVYNSKTYYLSSSQAVSAFHADPAKYAPAARGCDVIHQAITGEEIEGTLDYAVWYKGRLYMFSSAETMDTFVSAPSSHATLD